MRIRRLDSSLRIFIISSFLFLLSSCDRLYTFSGNVVGLKEGSEVSLENNGNDNQIVTISEDGEFKFGDVNVSEYDITVSTQPTDQTCTVINGKGDTGDDVDNIIILCSDSNP